MGVCRHVCPHLQQVLSWAVMLWYQGDLLVSSNHVDVVSMRVLKCTPAEPWHAITM